MNRTVLGVWIVIGFTCVYLGNGCAENFTFKEDLGPLNSINSSTCRFDETHLYDFATADIRTGYINNKTRINYIPQGQNWILVDGDRIIRTKGDLPEKPLPQNVQQGVGVQSNGRWPGGIIPYVISQNVPDRNRIMTAIDHWNANLAGVISLVPRGNQTDYIQFTGVSSGCASVVGYFQGAGMHPVNISSACDAGNIAHEIGHAVGLDHEQNRLDRDSYVNIQFDKVSSGSEVNFQIDSANRDYNFYDFGSLMHYSLYAFSVDGSRTIVPKVSVPSGTTVGQRRGLTIGDINSVRLMYGYPAVDPGTGVPDPGTSNQTHGLFARYHNGVDFKTVFAERIDPNIDFNWGSGAPVAGLGVDLFSIRWFGYLTPPADGVYKFEVHAMDPLRVRLENQNVFLFEGDNSIREAVSIQYQLSAGNPYPILIDYSSVSGDSYFQLYWTRPDGVREIIPSSAFTPHSDSSALAGCTGQLND